MKTTIKTLVAAATIACMSSFAQAQTSTTLQDLLKKVEQNATSQSRENQQREAEFKRNRDQQAGLLRQAKADLRAEEQRGDRLAAQFAANEQSLIDKEIELDQAKGDLGEMFGVVRQASSDAYGRISTSIVSAEFPGREEFLKEMSSDSKGLPNIEELRKLWVSLQTEMTASGQVSRFTKEVANLDGGKSEQSILRIGTFNLIGEQGYLIYDESEGQVTPLGRQPDSFQVNTTQDLLAAQSGFVPVFVDPSRGVILNLFKQKATWSERYHAGKEVGYTITAMLLIGLLIGLYKFVTLSAVGAKMKSQLKNVDSPNTSNPLGRILTVYADNKQADVETLELKLDEAILRELPRIDAGVNIIKIFAAIAPLLGLLGTVLGMIETFQQITLFGTGDPRIMAGSISMALVTTAQGIIAALPLILVHSIVAAKAKSIVHVLDEQTAGYIAAAAETEKA
ncbi:MULTISPECIES: MotA/TolQ/ExbB proton channel family protein [Alteromonadaceae]|jgi:biopolymer transport protein ExbB|uniref:MotA/TolQ/ExbB proton channel family protein n=1 Tax=Brumicola blandensis TaxID=3075611 RepID=A0AAW8R4A7_9ALTE|nr:MULTISPECIES: MotA/TolQ/ExbB proton channel family protein [unclassified Alteromonas]MDT0582908.1 MotA/TolQ/ExbB proton channel family protein [Alteromonas sp. W409]MDT0628324.1 MotA/TolQ/ExbB proton channel family protein [Alteromonas sp. W364]